GRGGRGDAAAGGGRAGGGDVVSGAGRGGRGDATGGRAGRGRGGSRGPARPSATEEGDAFQAWRMRIRALFREVLERHQLDGLFFPQAGAPIRSLVEDPERPNYN